MTGARVASTGTIHLRGVDLESIRRHAEETYPHECCGLLLGTLDATLDPPARLARLVEALDNEREESRHNRFLITPETMLRADRSARARGLEILGFYHSHPDAPAEPSEYDREHAWPFYSYIIVSVVQGQAGDLRSWRLTEDRGRFDAETVVPALED
jgi:proteasome lid subunit RPN8/RPN11